VRAVHALIALLPLGGLVWYSVDELEEAAAHAAKDSATHRQRRLPTSNRCGPAPCQAA